MRTDNTQHNFKQGKFIILLVLEQFNLYNISYHVVVSVSVSDDSGWILRDVQEMQK